MTREDARDLVQEVHGAYPAWKLDDPGTTINVWHKILEPFDLETAKNALYVYMDSSDRTYAPQPNQIKKITEKLIGKVSGEWYTMIYSRGVVRWQPEPNGDVYEIPVRWDATHEFLVDAEGREYADPRWWA